MLFFTKCQLLNYNEKLEHDKMIAGERYLIRDLATLSGIKAHTLRVWEKRYQILEPARSATNIRYYSANQLKDLLNISLLIRNGWKISKLAEMTAADRSALLMNRLNLKQDEGLYEQFMQSLTATDEQAFEKAYGRALKKGFEYAFTCIIFPFFEQVGLAWQTGAICTAQEHFFSSLVRQKLVAATNQVTLIKNPDAKKVLLLLPEFELHELGLLFYNYVFRDRGYHTLYLGQGVPLSGTEAVICRYRPNIVVTGSILSGKNEALNAFVQQLRSWLPEAIFYAAGLHSGEHMYSVHELRALLCLT